MPELIADRADGIGTVGQMADHPRCRLSHGHPADFRKHERQGQLEGRAHFGAAVFADEA